MKNSQNNINANYNHIFPPKSFPYDSKKRKMALIIYRFLPGYIYSPYEVLSRAESASRSTFYDVNDYMERMGFISFNGGGLYKRLYQPISFKTDELAGKSSRYPLPWGLGQAFVGEGDIIEIIGATGTGKSICAMNMAKHFVEKKYYIHYYASESLQLVADRLHKIRPALFWGKYLDIISVTRSNLSDYKLDSKSSDKIVVIDWLGLEGEYYRIAQILGRLQEQVDQGLLIVVIQGHWESEKRGCWPDRPIEPYGRESTKQRAALAFSLFWDKRDINHLYPYLGLVKVRESDTLKEGDRIALQYVPETKEMVRRKVVPSNNFGSDKNK